MTQHNTPLQKKIYEELVKAMKEDDEEVPYIQGSFAYYKKTVKGQDYAVYLRKPLNNKKEKGDEKEVKEEVVLDVNELAKDREYCDLGDWEVSDSGKFVAFSADYGLFCSLCCCLLLLCVALPSFLLLFLPFSLLPLSSFPSQLDTKILKFVFVKSPPESCCQILSKMWTVR
jgi:hypothetical protein